MTRKGKSPSHSHIPQNALDISGTEYTSYPPRHHSRHHTDRAHLKVHTYPQTARTFHSPSLWNCEDAHQSRPPFFHTAQVTPRLSLSASLPRSSYPCTHRRYSRISYNNQDMCIPWLKIFLLKPGGCPQAALLLH